MFKRVFKLLSLVISWLDVFFDSSKKLYPGRMAYKHELHTLAITQFDGNHLLIGEGEYDQVYAYQANDETPGAWQYDQTRHHPLRQIERGTLPDCRLGGECDHL